MSSLRLVSLGWLQEGCLFMFDPMAITCVARTVSKEGDIRKAINILRQSIALANSKTAKRKLFSGEFTLFL